MRYLIKNGEILLKIPIGNNGKFRFKEREKNIDFGKKIATRQTQFTDNTYLEWQIGYDIPVKEVNKSKLNILLGYENFKFQNNKGVDKYPYELSEIIYRLIQGNLITKEEIKSIQNEIENYKTFIEEKDITVEYYSQIKINGINYEETSIKLPTFFMVETKDKTIIEISIQKQQYAVGIQPMVYFCIPIDSFQDKELIEELKTRPSIKGEEFTYVINDKNVHNFKIMLKVFVWHLNVISLI
jgi:hypothetical protein